MLRVLFFGQLTDITGCTQLELGTVGDTDSLENVLRTQYPSLAQAKYVITVDRKIVRTKTKIAAGMEIALLPPFSGG
ncbi:MoaD/ThiS family protein [Olivibacter sp. XZL3]|uniref:MoaD/ThiS family protein n=1 Tax=Olivibacter sp. XZL3 TaxID=1735116 RepID=UPI0010666261|nr:MoaD/ThiS family protein [Olivibacter sp. XZL3]